MNKPSTMSVRMNERLKDYAWNDMETFARQHMPIGLRIRLYRSLSDDLWDRVLNVRDRVRVSVDAGDSE